MRFGTDDLFRSVLILLIALGLAAGCSEAGTDGEEVSDSNPGAEPPEDGVVENQTMWVKAYDEEAGLYFTHQDAGILGSPTALDLQTACEISVGETTNKDIICTAHTLEGNPVVRDVKVHVNIPPQMCRYLKTQNMYYYNFEVGQGPEQIEITYFEDGLTATECQVCSEFGNGATCTAVSAAVCPTNPIADEMFFDGGASEGNERCSYDHSEVNSFQPNCCYGDYQVREVLYDTSGGTIIGDETTPGSWQDSLPDSCFGGPSVQDSSWPRNLLNQPIPKFQNAWTLGINEAINATAIMGLPRNRFVNMRTANYYTPGTHAGDGNVPFAFSGGAPDSYMGAGLRTPGLDRSGDALFPGQDSYEFDCLDEAFERVHRIRLYIQEWNTLSEYLTYIAGDETANADGNPTTGNDDEGTDCDYINGGLCNDVCDWDDTVTPSAVAEGRRYLGAGTEMWCGPQGGFMGIEFPQEGY